MSIAPLTMLELLHRLVQQTEWVLHKQVPPGQQSGERSRTSRIEMKGAALASFEANVNVNPCKDR